MPMRWGKKLVGLQPASTTRSPPRADTPRRPYKTRPFSCEPPIYLWLNASSVCPGESSCQVFCCNGETLLQCSKAGRNLVLLSYGNVIDNAARGPLLDHLVGAQAHEVGHRKAERT